jgi:hypothetical protein
MIAATTATGMAIPARQQRRRWFMVAVIMSRAW